MAKATPIIISKSTNKNKNNINSNSSNVRELLLFLRLRKNQRNAADDDDDVEDDTQEHAFCHLQAPGANSHMGCDLVIVGVDLLTLTVIIVSAMARNRQPYTNLMLANPAWIRAST